MTEKAITLTVNGTERTITDIGDDAATLVWGDEYVLVIENAADLITEKREIKTSVLADDTETIVLGGLMNEDYRTTQSKVPLLGDIPFLGALFRSESQTKEKRNLVVFLRPTILREEGEGSEVAKEQFNRLWDVNLGITDNEDAKEKERPDVESVFDGNPLPEME